MMFHKVENRLFILLLTVTISCLLAIYAAAQPKIQAILNKRSADAEIQGTDHRITYGVLHQDLRWELFSIFIFSKLIDII